MCKTKCEPYWGVGVIELHSPTSYALGCCKPWHLLYITLGQSLEPVKTKAVLHFLCLSGLET